MYTLRRIFKQGGVEQNFALGDNYSVIHRDISRPDFERNYNIMFGIDDENHPEWKSESAIQKEIHTIITSQLGATYPLYSDSWWYVMGDKGNTISNLSFKP